MLTTTFLVIALAGAAPAGPMELPVPEQPAKAARSDEVLKVYDARDLNVMMPATQSGDAASDQVMTRLSGALRMNLTPLSRGLYAATGSEEQHVALQRLIEDLRGVQGQPYEIDVSLYTVSAESAPAIGSAAKPGPESVRARASIRGGAATQIEAVRTLTFLADWSPVVSDHSMGFDPQSSTAEDGLKMEVTLGTRAKDGVIGLTVEGEIAKADVKSHTLLVVSKDQPLTMEFPQTERRPFTADTRVRLGEATVIAVVPGFEPGQALVLSAAVREIKGP